MSIEANMAMEGSEISSISDDTPSIDMSVDTNGPTSADMHPIYRTNWVPNFSTFEEAHRKISMKSFRTVADVNDIQVKTTEKNFLFITRDILPSSQCSQTTP